MTTVYLKWKYPGNNVKCAGTFNGWKQEDMYCNGYGVWEKIVTLEPGTYYYKFIVDDNWYFDMEKPSANDLQGNTNNILTVEPNEHIPDMKRRQKEYEIKKHNQISSQNPEWDYLIKVLLIGDSNVGKTSLILCYMDCSKRSDIMMKSSMVDNHQVQIQIWEAKKHSKFKIIIGNYYRGTGAILIVYDVTKPASFMSVRGWLQEIERHTTGNSVKVLVGNKCDLTKQRQVTTEEGQDLANQLNLMFFETSTKNTEQVCEIFTKAAAKFIKNLMK